MSASPLKTKRNSVQSIRGLKNREQAFLALTAYTAPIARLGDAVADLLLIGDSLGMVLYGMENTLGVTIDLMLPHARAVLAASQKALVVCDMPFGTYQAAPSQAFENAARIIKETNVQAVKLEGGAEMAPTIRFLVERGIPVMAHIGLMPQQVHQMSGYKVQGKNESSVEKLLLDAKAVDEAGAFSVVVEGVVENVAALITKTISIPTIGIGASAACDGQILVAEDVLGFTPGPRAKFVKPYAELYQTAHQALEQLADDVKARRFPDSEHVYGASPDGNIPSKAAPHR